MGAEPNANTPGVFPGLSAPIPGLWCRFVPFLRLVHVEAECKKPLFYGAYLVGAPRFELGTPSPPDWCANRAALRSERRWTIVIGGGRRNRGDATEADGLHPGTRAVPARRAIG